jgi:hypothetical protein
MRKACLPSFVVLIQMRAEEHVELLDRCCEQEKRDV